MSKKKEAAEEVTAVEEDSSAAVLPQNDGGVNAKDDGFCIYLGPTIARVINHGRMFKGTREAALEELKDRIFKYPLIADLLIRGEDLAEERIKIKTPGNLLYRKYKELEKSLAL